MPFRIHRSLAALLCSFSLFGASGCKSAFVEAVVRNGTDQPITLIEVDYPSASFGREALAAHAEFHYRFKILGSGSTRIQWTDARHQEHSKPGPELHEGQEGRIEISVSEASAAWAVQLK